MPWEFEYEGPDVYFVQDLNCKRCIAKNRQGKDCKLITCIGLPYCWVHLYYLHHLRIKQSTIPNAGNGVFAMDGSKPEKDIIFKKGAHITDFYGEILNLADIKARYGKNNAPYGILISGKDGIYEDGAIERGVGSLINHKPHSQANAKLSLSKNKRIKIIATKNIRNNQEIFVDYGKDYKMNEPYIEYSTKKRNETKTIRKFKRYTPF